MAKRAKGHISKEELQKDEVAETITSAQDFLVRNRVLLIALALAVVGGTVGGSVWNSRKVQSGAAKAEDLFQASLFLASRHTIDDPELFRTRLDEAVASLRSLIDRAGTDETGRMAHRMLGDCYSEQREFDKALEQYRIALSAAKSGREKAMYEVRIGMALEGRHFETQDDGLLEEAAGRYDAAARTAPPRSRERYFALYQKARVLEAQGSDAEALELYKVIMEERPDERPTPTLEETYEMVFPSQLGRVSHQQLMMRLGPADLHNMARARHDRLVASADTVNQAWIPVPEHLKPTPSPVPEVGPDAPPRFSIPSSSVVPGGQAPAAAEAPAAEAAPAEAAPEAAPEAPAAETGTP